MTRASTGGMAPWGPLAALQFLTRIPIRLSRAPAMERIPPWFPVAGGIIGVMAGGIGSLTLWATTPLVAAAVTVAVGLVITGAFHEDGLGDVADAFGGGHDVARRLEILKDSRHGTYGVSAIATSIVLRVAAIASLPDARTLFAVVVATHVVARAAAVVLMAAAPLARHEGLGVDYGQSTNWARATIASSSGLAIALFTVGWWVVAFAAAALIGIAATGMLARSKIGGISGDVLGAGEQVAEMLVLVVAVGLARHHVLWWG